MSNAALSADVDEVQAVGPGEHPRWRRYHLGGATEAIAPYIYVAPGLALYVALVLVPLVKGVRLSLYSSDGLSPPKWVGLHNFRELFADPLLRAAFIHAFELIIFYSVIPISLGLLIAGTISARRIRGVGAYRTTLFLPQILPGVAVGVIWSWIYAPNGLINFIAGKIGFGHVTVPWLGEFSLALPAVGLIGTWVTFGFCMVLFLAGTAKIAPSLYDAARVDGAGPIREFFAVTLPGLRGELVIAAMLTIIAALRSFDIIYVTTQGGPGTSTTVPSYEVYRQAFVVGSLGTAAALGVALAAVIVVLVFCIRLLDRHGAT